MSQITDNIPKVIHQIWLGPLAPPNAAMESWVTNHPDWEYKLWTEKNLPALKNQAAFDKSDNYPQKADILRYEILFQFGGVYFDADVHCIKPIDVLYEQWLSNGDSLVAANEGNPSNTALLANTFIASNAANAFMGQLVDGINVDQEGGAWEITGPQYFTESIARFKPEINILSSKVFFPIHHGDKEHRLIDLDVLSTDPDIYGVHLWTGTKRAYEPVWYRHPLDYLFLQLRKSLNKTFQIKLKR